MFRDDKKPEVIEKVNALISDGGLGDLLCYLVPMNYLVNTATWLDITVWVPDYLLEFTKNVLPNANVKNYTQAKAEYDHNSVGITTQWKSQHTPMRTHPIDYAYRMLTDGDAPTQADRNYLKFDASSYDLDKFQLPENYVVISVGATSKVKEMPANIMNEISDYVISKGLTPVYLGKEVSPSGYENRGIFANIVQADYSKGINLVNKTSICESAAIISKAKLFIGMEGGLTHLAGFIDVKVVAGYTFVDPKKMMPIRENKQGYNVFVVEPEASLGCRFCQSNIPLLYGHDFRNCIYDDFTCVKQLTIDKWKKAIDDATN